MFRRWSKQEDLFLVKYWSLSSTNFIGKSVGRSPRAVTERARRLGLGPQSRGTVTLLEFSGRTGYSRSRIITAAFHLGMYLGKVPRGDSKPRKTKNRWHAITPEVQDRIVAYLSSIPDGRRIYKARQGSWTGPNHRGGRKPGRCIDCGRNDVPHFCRGRCKRCDRRWRISRVR